MLSTHSFNALLKTLEEPPEHVVFLLATTDPQKLPATVLSRCLQFKLQSMSPEQVDQHLQHILQAEDIPFDAEATQLISHAAKGSMRDALSLLDQSIAHGNGEVRVTSVREMLGTIDAKPLCDILTAVADQNGEELLLHVANLRRAGVDFSVALRELSALIQEMAVVQVIGTNSSRTQIAAVPELAKRFDATNTQLMYQIALKGLEDMPFAPTPEQGFEMTLLRMLAFQLDDSEISVAAPATTNRPVHAAQRQAPATQAPQARRQPPAAAAPVNKAQPTRTAASGDSAWHKIVAELQLRGLTQVLAQSCQLIKKTDNCWNFTLDKKQGPLLQPRTEQALTQALSSYLDKPISIKVEFSDGTTTAQAAPTTQPSQEAAVPPPATKPVSSAPKQADNPAHQDPEVQRIMQTFSGKLDDQRVVNNNDN